MREGAELQAGESYDRLVRSTRRREDCAQMRSTRHFSPKNTTLGSGCARRAVNTDRPSEKSRKSLSWFGARRVWGLRCNSTERIRFCSRYSLSSSALSGQWLPMKHITSALTKKINVKMSGDTTLGSPAILREMRRGITYVIFAATRLKSGQSPSTSGSLTIEKEERAVI
jgi:hypothetical protein